MIKNECVEGTESEEERGTVAERLKKEFSDLNDSGMKCLGRVVLTQSVINTEDAEPVRSGISRVPDQRVGELNMILDEMLEAGVIVKSESVWCSPTMCVPKRDGSLRLCIDYRELNKLTVRDSFEVPSFGVILKRVSNLCGNVVFTTLVLASAFYQFLLKEEDRVRTAFYTDRGVFEFVVMPFGLSNAAAVLQRVVEEVLGDLLGKVCFAQLDEIIVCSKSFADHEKDLREVLSKFRIAGLKIEFNNCNWVREEVKYLGHSVSKEGIKTLLDQHKLNVCFVKNEDFTAEERLEVLGRIEERFTDIGANSLMDLGKTCLIEHEVNTGTAKPIKQSMRRVPFAMKEEFK